MAPQLLNISGLTEQALLSDQNPRPSPTRLTLLKIYQNGTMMVHQHGKPPPTTLRLSLSQLHSTLIPSVRETMSSLCARHGYGLITNSPPESQQTQTSDITLIKSLKLLRNKSHGSVLNRNIHSSNTKISLP